MRLCRIHDPIVWAAIPSAADIAEALNPKLLLYQVSDKYDANEDSALSAPVIRELDRRLKERAAVVLYSGRKLFQESEVEHRYFLEQAVDFNHFATTSAVETAPDIVDIPHPVLGYFGAMDYVMDVDLIAEVARRRPNWHWVMIGLKSNAVQVNASNVHFLGSKPYPTLPQYIRHFDVCVLPWRMTNTFTSYGSAIKVREYLATGKPVVIAPLYEYRNTPGLRLYDGVEQFISQVEEALDNDTAADRELRQSVVRDSTWEVRAREVGSLISSLLSANTCTPGRTQRRAADLLKGAV
jgi:glycosyltransferase involved in cell wall biosynthesis